MKSVSDRMSWISVAILMSMTAMHVGSAFADSDSDAKHLVGSWMATVTATHPPGLPPLTSLITFSPGGGVVESRRLFVPDSPFGTLIATPGHGEWIISDDGEILVKFVFLQQSFDTGELTSKDTISLALRLEESANGGYELTGSFNSVVRDLDGTVLFRATGTYEADPILVPRTSRDDDD